MPLNAEAYLQASHVLVSGRASGPSLVDYALNSLGLKRNIGVRCQHYFAACHMLSQLRDSKTNMLLTMPKRYAVSLCQRFTELHMHRFPFDSQNIDVYLYWHQSLDKDAANMWFRQFLNELIAKQGL